MPAAAVIRKVQPTLPLNPINPDNAWLWIIRNANDMPLIIIRRHNVLTFKSKSMNSYIYLDYSSKCISLKDSRTNLVISSFLTALVRPNMRVRAAINF